MTREARDPQQNKHRRYNKPSRCGHYMPYRSPFAAVCRGAATFVCTFVAASIFFSRVMQSTIRLLTQDVYGVILDEATSISYGHSRKENIPEEPSIVLWLVSPHIR